MSAAASLALDDVVAAFFPRIEFDRARGGVGKGGVAIVVVVAVPLATIGFKMTGPLVAAVVEETAGADFRFSRDEEGGGKAR